MMNNIVIELEINQIARKLLALQPFFLVPVTCNTTTIEILNKINELEDKKIELENKIK